MWHSMYVNNGRDLSFSGSTRQGLAVYGRGKCDGEERGEIVGAGGGVGIRGSKIEIGNSKIQNRVGRRDCAARFVFGNGVVFGGGGLSCRRADGLKLC